MEELEELLKLLNANNVLCFEGLGYKLEFAEAEPSTDFDVESDDDGDWTEIPTINPN